MRTLFTFIFLTFIHFSVLQAQCAASTNSVSDSIGSNNGQRGQMFNIVALTDITIHCFSPDLYTGVFGTYYIYYRNGSHVGHQYTAASWTFIDSAQSLTGAANVGTLIPIDVNIPISAGDTVAFYITCRGTSPSYGGIRYYGHSAAPAGPLDSTWMVDANMKLLVGVGKDYPFGTNFVTRRYLGGVHYSMATPLPLNFLSFHAENKESYNFLQWTTENEVNTSHFEVEKSQDGETFEKIGIVSAAKNSNTQLNYEFQDQYFALGKNYYRLTCHDIDGKYTHSEIITIHNDDRFENIQIFPNPFQQAISIKIDDYEQPFYMIDVYGKIIYQSTEVPKIIDTQNLFSGIYFLKIGAKSISVVKE